MQHDKYIKAITDAEAALEKAKAEYKAYCKENPLPAPKQPTIHELRQMSKPKPKPEKAEAKK